MMEYLYERIAYLRGLAEGMKIDENSDNGKLMVNVLEVLSDFADAINELNDAQEEMDEYIEALDEDLSSVEDEIYGEEDDLEDFEDEEDYDYIEVECPHCHEYVYLDEELLENGENVVCPNCHEPIEYELDYDCEGGCSCGHDHHHE
jgi:formylmethanofuran dehydrogenase subunit E